MSGLQPLRQNAVHLFFHRVAVAQVGDPHLITGQPDALDPTLALLQAGRAPGKINVDQGAEPVQVEALGSGINANQQLDLPIAQAILQQRAVVVLEAATKPEARAAAAGVKPDGARCQLRRRALN